MVDEVPSSGTNEHVYGDINAPHSRVAILVYPGGNATEENSEVPSLLAPSIGTGSHTFPVTVVESKGGSCPVPEVAEQLKAVESKKGASAESKSDAAAENKKGGVAASTGDYKKQIPPECEPVVPQPSPPVAAPHGDGAPPHGTPGGSGISGKDGTGGTGGVPGKDGAGGTGGSPGKEGAGGTGAHGTPGKDGAGGTGAHGTPGKPGAPAGSGRSFLDDHYDIRKWETAPFDPRFHSQNQTRYCQYSYIDWYRCRYQKGDHYLGCSVFKKNVNAICPPSWIEKWEDEVRRGVFPCQHLFSK